MYAMPFAARWRWHSCSLSLLDRHWNPREHAVAQRCSRDGSLPPSKSMKVHRARAPDCRSPRCHSFLSLLSMASRPSIPTNWLFQATWRPLAKIPTAGCSPVRGLCTSQQEPGVGHVESGHGQVGQDVSLSSSDSGREEIMALVFVGSTRRLLWPSSKSDVALCEIGGGSGQAWPERSGFPQSFVLQSHRPKSAASSASRSAISVRLLAAVLRWTQRTGVPHRWESAESLSSFTAAAREPWESGHRVRYAARWALGSPRIRFGLSSGGSWH